MKVVSKIADEGEKRERRRYKVVRDKRNKRTKKAKSPFVQYTLSHSLNS
jgi:hypothetical protein